MSETTSTVKGRVEPSAMVTVMRPPRSRRFDGSYASSGAMPTIVSTRPSGCSTVPCASSRAKPGAFTRDHSSHIA